MLAGTIVYVNAGTQLAAIHSPSGNWGEMLPAGTFGHKGFTGTMIWIDPESPYHKPVFAEDKRFVFFCAGGWRSALAAETAQRMGLKPVAHIRGGFGEWKKQGGPIEPAQE